jgi:ribosomal protein S16
MIKGMFILDTQRSGQKVSPLYRIVVG